MGNFVNAAYLSTGQDYRSLLRATDIIPLIPEPSTYVLMGIGLLGLGCAHRRKQKINEFLISGAGDSRSKQ